MVEARSQWTSSLETDVVLPAQFYGRMRHRTMGTGERRLMAALLEDALHVCSTPLRSPTAKRRQLLRETLRWVRSDDRTWVCSFLRVCETLDLDPATIRHGMLLRGRSAVEGKVASGAGRGFVRRHRPK